MRAPIVPAPRMATLLMRFISGLIMNCSSYLGNMIKSTEQISGIECWKMAFGTIPGRTHLNWAMVIALRWIYLGLQSHSEPVSRCCDCAHHVALCRRSILKPATPPDWL